LARASYVRIFKIKQNEKKSTAHRIYYDIINYRL
jgi:hypothetical protein